jgi:lipoyl synthase
MAYPDWLRQLLRSSPGQALTPAATRLAQLVQSLDLKTVCQTARCPNRGRCWSRGTATFLLLGDICTRGCRFCNLSPGHPQAVDDDEPWRLLQAVRDLGLRHVVITAVTRDDLPDGGAGHFSETIRVLRRGGGHLTIEVLTPDFQGKMSSLETLGAATPNLWGHNVETVPRLYPDIRLDADYTRSLKLLAWIKDLRAGIITKSGLMLGLGETPSEVDAVLQDLRQAGVDHLTLGQYLAPSPRHVPVARYVTPEEFASWGRIAAALGFASVQSGPLVRSSYADTPSPC